MNNTISLNCIILRKRPCLDDVFVIQTEPDATIDEVCDEIRDHELRYRKCDGAHIAIYKPKERILATDHSSFITTMEGVDVDEFDEFEEHPKLEELPPACKVANVGLADPPKWELHIVLVLSELFTSKQTGLLDTRTLKDPYRSQKKVVNCLALGNSWPFFISSTFTVRAASTDTISAVRDKIRDKTLRCGYSDSIGPFAIYKPKESISVVDQRKFIAAIEGLNLDQFDPFEDHPKFEPLVPIFDIVEVGLAELPEEELHILAVPRDLGWS